MHQYWNVKWYFRCGTYHGTKEWELQHFIHVIGCCSSCGNSFPPFHPTQRFKDSLCESNSSFLIRWLCYVSKLIHAILVKEGWMVFIKPLKKVYFFTLFLLFILLEARFHFVLSLLNSGLRNLTGICAGPNLSSSAAEKVYLINVR